MPKLKRLFAVFMIITLLCQFAPALALAEDETAAAGMADIENVVLAEDAAEDTVAIKDVGTWGSGYMTAMTQGPDGSIYILGSAGINTAGVYVDKLYTVPGRTGMIYQRLVGPLSSYYPTHGLHVDTSGNIYIGVKTSTTAKILKFGPSGGSPINTYNVGTWADSSTSTLVGMIYTITTDTAGNIYAGGGTNQEMGFADPLYAYNDHTHYVDEPVSDGSVQHGFLVKFTSENESAAASTYWGGPVRTASATNGNSYIKALKFDEAGNLYGVGTFASDLMFLDWQYPSAFQPELPGGYRAYNTSYAAFAAKFSTEDFEPLAATYLGGTSSDWGEDLAIYGNYLYVTGSTSSYDFPKHAESPVPAHLTGTYLGPYVARLNKDLTAAGYAATEFPALGSSYRSDAYKIAVDGSGVYAAGTSSGMNSTDGSGTAGIYLARLSSSLNDFIALTLKGGANSGAVRGLFLNNEGVVAAGNRGSNNLAKTIDIYDENTLTPLTGTNDFIITAGRTISEAKLSGFTANREANTYLSAGDALEITATFGVNVKIQGEEKPRLKLNIANADRYAEYVRGSGTAGLVFKYTVQPGDRTNLTSITTALNVTAFELNGASIVPVEGNETVNLTLPTSNTLSSRNIYVQTDGPAMSAVTMHDIDFNNKKATYSLGTIIQIRAQFDDNSLVFEGTPRLKLNVGEDRYAEFISTYGTNAGNFEYIVQESDSTNGDILRITGLDFTNGTIKDRVGNLASQKLLDNGAVPSNSTTTEIKIEASLPYVKAMRFINHDARPVYLNNNVDTLYYKANEQIKIELDFSEPVDINGTLNLRLLTSSTTNPAKSEAFENAANVTTVEFIYNTTYNNSTTTNASQNYYDVGSLTTLGTVKASADSRDVSLALPSWNNGRSGLLRQNSLVVAIENSAPGFSSVTTPEATYSTGAVYYKAGDKVKLNVALSKPYLVTGLVPAIPTINTGNSEGPGEWLYVGYADGSTPATPSSTLRFEYTVREGDSALSTADYPRFTGNQTNFNETIKDRSGTAMTASTTTSISATATTLQYIRFDNVPPEWPEDAAITLSAITHNAVALSWPAATDNAAIGGYEVYAGDELVGTATNAQYTITGLLPESQNAIKVIALDKAGNKSGPLTISVSTVVGEDNTPPVWVADAVLKMERLGAASAKLTWDVAQVSDPNGAIAGYKIYQKSGDGEYELIATLDDPNTVEYIVTSLTTEVAYAFRIEAFCGAALESSNGPTVQARERYAYLKVIDGSGDVLKEYIAEDFNNLEWDENYPRSNFGAPIYYERYTGYSNSGGNYYHKYSAVGVSLKWLLTDAGVNNCSKITFWDEYMSSLQSLAADSLFDTTRYYYPNIAMTGDREAGAVEVEPMIAFYYKSAEITNNPTAEPDFNFNEYGPRLLLGQSNIGDANRSLFMKDVYYIVVDSTDKPIDRTPPTITLKGNEVMSIALGTNFVDPGATAQDAFGVDLTSKIKISGSVNPNREGEYTLTYSVTDTRGNTASISRTAVVYAGYSTPGIYTVDLQPGGDYTVKTEPHAIPYFEVTGGDTSEREVEFMVAVRPAESYAGGQTLIMTHMRAGEQIGLAAVKQDFNKDMEAGMGFIVLPGDQIRVYLTDDLGPNVVPIVLYTTR